MQAGVRKFEHFSNKRGQNKEDGVKFQRKKINILHS